MTNPIDEVPSDPLKEIAVAALEQLLIYAKYLEDNNTLTYDLLKQRVETYRNSNE